MPLAPNWTGRAEGPRQAVPAAKATTAAAKPLDIDLTIGPTPMTARPLPSSPDRSSAERRTPAGSNYGDVVPASPRHDPSRGAELERDAMPATADFGKPPPNSAAARETQDPHDAPTPDEPIERQATRREGEPGEAQAGRDGTKPMRP